jgi:hypothetical protein
MRGYRRQSFDFGAGMRCVSREIGDSSSHVVTGEAPAFPRGAPLPRT